MNDLNLVTFFKASFGIRKAQNDGDTDILWELVCAIRTWLRDKYNKNDQELIPSNRRLWTKFKKYGSALYSLDKDKIVYCKSISYTSQKNETQYWACRITESPEPAYDYASRQWITEIVYRENASDGRFDLVVKYRDRAGYIGHYEEQPQITVPRLIRLILQHRELLCHSGNIPLNAFPTELNTGDGTKLRDLIFNPVRDLPLIYISPRKTSNKWTDIGELLVSPNEINKCVLGNAYVFFSKSIEFSEEMDYLLGRNYQCHYGDIRVYFPINRKSEEHDDPRRHRLIFASTISEWGEKEILAIFRKALAQNSDYFRRVLDYDYCSFTMDREEHEKQMLEKVAAIKRRDEQIESIKSASEEERAEIFDMALEDYDKLSKEHESLIDDFDKLEKERSELKQQVYNLNSQIEVLNRKSDGGLADENSKRLLVRLKEMPSDCQDVVRIIEAAFPDRIIFTKKAQDSLRDCVTSPKLLWSLLYAMATDFYDRLKKTPATAAEDFANSFGIDYARGAGSMTRKDRSLMRQYLVQYNEHVVNIEKHFKKGNNDADEQNIRVYFAWEPDICDKIIIGHCGKHIDNWSTRNRH